MAMWFTMTMPSWVGRSVSDSRDAPRATAAEATPAATATEGEDLAPSTPSSLQQVMSPLILSSEALKEPQRRLQVFEFERIVGRVSLTSGGCGCGGGGFREAGMLPCNRDREATPRAFCPSPV